MESKNNFKHYYKRKKGIFKELGVKKSVAKMIWGDALDALLKEVIQKFKN